MKLAKRVSQGLCLAALALVLATAAARSQQPSADNTTATANLTSAAAALPGDVTAVRSCLSYNILILPGSNTTANATGPAANATTPGNATSADGGGTTSPAGSGSGNATISMTAADSVINATDLAYSDGILTLSLLQVRRVVKCRASALMRRAQQQQQERCSWSSILGPVY